MKSRSSEPSGCSWAATACSARAITLSDHPTRGLDRYPVSLGLADPRACHAASLRHVLDG